MSDLGKIRAGSPRVYRDRLFGIRGQVTTLAPDASADGLVRYVLHPDDATEEEARVVALRIERIETETHALEALTRRITGDD